MRQQGIIRRALSIVVGTHRQKVIPGVPWPLDELRNEGINVAHSRLGCGPGLNSEGATHGESVPQGQ
jgi:hypothetical protein